MKTIFTSLILLTLSLVNLSAKAQSISCTVVGMGSFTSTNCDSVGDAYCRIFGVAYPCDVIYTTTDVATNIVFRDTVTLLAQTMFPGAFIGNLRGMGTISVSVTDANSDTCSSSFNYAFFDQQKLTVDSWYYKAGSTPGKFDIVVNYSNVGYDTVRYGTFFLYQEPATAQSPPIQSLIALNVLPLNSDSIIFSNVDSGSYALNGGGPEWNCASTGGYFFKSFMVPAGPLKCGLVMYGTGYPQPTDCDSSAYANFTVNGGMPPYKVIYTITESATNTTVQDTITAVNEVNFPGAYIGLLNGVGTISISIIDGLHDTCTSTSNYAYFHKQMPTVDNWYHTDTIAGKFNIVVNYHNATTDTLRYATFYLYNDSSSTFPVDSKTIINIIPNSSDSIVFINVDSGFYSLNGGGAMPWCPASFPYIFQHAKFEVVGLKNNMAIVSKINLMPNPANDWTTISIANELAGTIMVYDIIGNIVATEKLVNGIAPLNTGALANGTYIIVASTNQNKSIAKLIVAHR